MSTEEFPLPNDSPDRPNSVDPNQAPDTDQSARQQLIDEVLSPYHIHYDQGIEGHQSNPEAAEFNFDTLLVLTKMIREKAITSRKDKNQPWDANPDIDWYFEKYRDHGVDKRNFDQPTKVASLWLKKLGPHNDLSDTHDQDPELELGLDAADDLLSARDWLVSEASRPGAKKPDHGLIAELNLELAEITHDQEASNKFLQEAAQYLDRHVKDKSSSGELDKAALSRMKLASVHIELARQKHLGTPLLTRDPDPMQYIKFEADVEASLDQLRVYFKDTLDHIDAQYSPDPDDSDEQQIEKTNKLAHACGRLFEVYDYLEVMEGIIVDDGLAISKYRPGFFREESGTAHKIDFHPNSRRITRDDQKVELGKHGFNYNFDFVYSTIIDNPRPGEGYLRSIYYQLKIDPQDANTEAADEASNRFFPGKSFVFTQPRNLDEQLVYSGNDREYLENLMHAMQQSALTTQTTPIELDQ